MSGSGQSSERLSQNPVRIVYHAGNRTFARLFNERSLEEVKHVVRRKLGLGLESDVSLKQMGSDALLDLEDDGDFQAFRVFLQSSVSVDIQVTVRESRGSAVPPTVVPQPQEQPTASKPTRTSLSPRPSGVVPGSATASGPQILSNPTRKRKASIENAIATASGTVTERGAPVALITPVASAKIAESSSAPQPGPSVEPPKKKQRKESTMAKPTGRVPPTPAVVTPVASAKTAESAAAAAQPVGAAEPKKKTRKEPTKTKPTEQVALPEPNTATPDASAKAGQSSKPLATDEALKKKAPGMPAMKTTSIESRAPQRPAAATPDASVKAGQSSKPLDADAAPKRKEPAMLATKTTSIESRAPRWPAAVTPDASVKAGQSSKPLDADAAPKRKGPGMPAMKTTSIESRAPRRPAAATPDASAKAVESPEPLDADVAHGRKNPKRFPRKTAPMESLRWPAAVTPDTSEYAEPSEPSDADEAPKRKEHKEHKMVTRQSMLMESRAPRGPAAVTPDASEDAESSEPSDVDEAPKRKEHKEHKMVTRQSMLMESRAPREPAAVTPDASEDAESPEPSDADEAPEPIPIRNYTSRVARRGFAFPIRKHLWKPPLDDVQTIEGAESPAAKASGSKTRPKKLTTSDRADEAGTSGPKATEASGTPAMKQKKQKKDDSTRSKKSSAPTDQDDTDKPIDQPSDSAPLQPAAEDPVESSAKGGALETYINAPKGMVCASIPQTNASKNVRSEVAAAILSGYLSTLPEPPAKAKSVKRDTKKSSASSNALPVEPTTMLDAPANETPNIPAEHGLEQTILTNELPQQTPNLNAPSCPICLEKSFHIRYYCPIVLKGPDAIRERLEELKRTNTGDHHLLIKQLEGLLREPEVPSKPSLDLTPTDDVQLDKASTPPKASLPRTSNMPSNSYFSEVTVEGRDEGSSSDGSDGTSDEEDESQESSAPRTQNTPDKQPSHSEEEQAELEEDPDEEASRSRRRLSTRMSLSSDSESGEEESRSPSPSRSADDPSNDLGPGVQSSNKSSEKFAENQEGDVVMQDSVEPHVLEEQDDDSSEETHVGSEDRMAVDKFMGEKGVITGVQEQPSPSAPGATVLQPSDAPRDEPQEPATAQVDPDPDRDCSVLIATDVLKEVEADPIESAEDLEPAVASRLLNADPIEAPSEDVGSFLSSLTQSTPKPGVSKRIKTRSGQALDNEADGPVLLEQLASETTNEVTPAPVKGKSRGKSSFSQEPVPSRKSPRLPPSTSTPAAVALLNHKSKSRIRTGYGKGVKTPAKEGEERLDASKSGAKDAAQNIAPTPSSVRWEILAEPSSPSVPLDEPSVHIDELMSSSPYPEENNLVHPNNGGKKGRPRKVATSSQAESSQGKERLFDLSSSQIPFPYSQNFTDPAQASLNGKGGEGTTDSEDEEPKIAKRLATAPARFRSLSQLATQATLFSPSLPMTTNKSVTNGKAKNRAAADTESSSSSSSSDADEANGSGHIPRGREAGSTLKMKKRKGLLSKI